jgi:hypothetical protein
MSNGTLDKQAIALALQRHHQHLTEHLLRMDREALEWAPVGKWTPMQHLEHLLRGVRPVSLGLLLPRWSLRIIVGRPRRVSRSYPELVERYTSKLVAGGRARGMFVPPVRHSTDLERLSHEMARMISTLNMRLARWSEQELDGTLMPHPLLGKVTVREMLYFTIYHVQHHLALIERDRKRA